MTRYEELMEKSNACLEKAKNTSGLMRSIWQHHAFALEQMARSLTIAEL